jgi:hypothetical protein
MAAAGIALDPARWLVCEPFGYLDDIARARRVPENRDGKSAQRIAAAIADAWPRTLSCGSRMPARVPPTASLEPQLTRPRRRVLRCSPIACGLHLFDAKTEELPWPRNQASTS